MQNYTVKTEYFEGPLHILLSLIEKRKLLINKLSLSLVTEEFINFTQNLDENFSIKEKSNFVQIISILLLIKAKSLLPTLDISEEEKEDSDALEWRLKKLQYIRDISKNIEKIYGKDMIYNQGNFRKDIQIFAPSKDINIENIKESLQRIFKKLPKEEEKIPEIKVRKVISIEEMMLTVSKKIKQAIKMTFSECLSLNIHNFENEKEKKQYTVISFLALLELVKQNEILVEQISHRDIISIESLTAPETPQYI